MKTGKVSRAALQGRRARPLHANGLKGCPWGLDSGLLLSRKSGSIPANPPASPTSPATGLYPFTICS